MATEEQREATATGRPAAGRSSTRRRDSTAVGAEAHALHQSLVREPLFLGVTFRMLALEGILAVGLLFLVGLDPMGLVVLAVLILCIHVPARRLVARDPLLMTVARDALDFRPFYSPQSLVHEAPPAPAPSITTTEG